MDCARTALRGGASQVTVAYRRSRKEMPAIAEEIDEAIHEGITLRELRAPVAFGGNGRVASIDLAIVELGEPDESGRRRPVVSKRIEHFECNAVLLAIGQSADLSLLPEGWELREGQIHENGQALRVFAAGDLSTGDGTVTHAIGDGRRAAGKALRSLGVDVTVFERPDRQTAIPATDIRFDHFLPAAPSRDRVEEKAVREGFVEVNRGLADAVEAHRCFSCGHCTDCDTCLVYCPDGVIHRAPKGGYDIDYSYCKGCGICTTECPRGAMELRPECPSN
jgi:2-oxoacid:acceptor oxidoreductase delta subunit (pyruvate/2-ketoisovalerate family)